MDTHATKSTSRQKTPQKVVDREVGRTTPQLESTTDASSTVTGAKKGETSLLSQPQKATSSFVEGAFSSPSGMWYGVDSLEQNLPAHGREKTKPAQGKINEGPCGAIVDDLIAALSDNKALTKSFMVGCVQSMDGRFFVATSGKQPAGFKAAVAIANAKHGNLVCYDGKGGISGKAVIGDDTTPSTLAKNRVRTFEGKFPDMPGVFENRPAPESEDLDAALGVPGSCALPKLIKQLIKLEDPPIHASEKWFAPKNNPISIIARHGETPTEYHHGEAVPSCYCCRQIVPYQMRGVAEVLHRKTAAKLKAGDLAEGLRISKIREDAMALAQKQARIAELTSLMTAGLKAFTLPIAGDAEQFEEAKELFAEIVEAVVVECYEALRKPLDAHKVELASQQATATAVKSSDVKKKQKGAREAKAEKDVAYEKENLDAALAEAREDQRLATIEGMWAEIPEGAFEQEKPEPKPVKKGRKTKAEPAHAEPAQPVHNHDVEPWLKLVYHLMEVAETL